MLREAVRRHVTLYLPRKDGNRLADHCEAVAAQRGEWPEEFPQPDVPEIASDLWDWFWELRSTAGGFDGPAPIAYREMQAWAELLQLEIKPVHVRFIRVMDAQYINSVYDLKKKK